MANFPTEMVNLPSKGKLYPKTSPLSKGEVELKYMTAKEEDILTSINLIRKGIVLDKLLEALIVDKSIKLDDMLVGDKNAILIAARILGYGKEYTLQALCDACDERSQLKVDCTKFKDIEIDDKIKENKFSIDLPTTKVKLEFKLLTSAEELEVVKEVEGLQKIQPDLIFHLAEFSRIVQSFQYFEDLILEQLDGALFKGGFDVGRDIAGITVNRWPHGYAWEYNDYSDPPEYNPYNGPHIEGRKQIGRISIANSDSSSYAYVDGAIDAADRAVNEQLKS